MWEKALKPRSVRGGVGLLFAVLVVVTVAGDDHLYSALRDVSGHAHGRAGCAGGGLAAVVFLGTSLALGNVGEREALILLESTLPTIRFLCSAAIGASATILALMLTLLGLSQDMEGEIHPDYFTRIQHIATMSVWAMVGGVGLLVILVVPLGESEDISTWYSVIYYAILVMASLLGGGLVAVGVQRIAGLGLEPLHAMALQRGGEALFGELHAFQQGLKRGTGAFLGVLVDARQRARKIVGHVQHVARKAGHGVFARLLHVALGALFGVLHLRIGAQELVLGLGELGVEIGFFRSRLGAGVERGAQARVIKRDAGAFHDQRRVGLPAQGRQLVLARPGDAGRQVGGLVQGGLTGLQVGCEDVMTGRRGPSGCPDPGGRRAAGRTS